MSMQRIRDYYGVPAKRGMRVTVDGKPGVVTGTTRGPMHLRVRFDHAPKHTIPAHPTWEVEYHTPETETTPMSDQYRSNDE